MHGISTTTSWGAPPRTALPGRGERPGLMGVFAALEIARSDDNMSEAARKYGVTRQAIQALRKR